MPGTTINPPACSTKVAEAYALTMHEYVAVQSPLTILVMSDGATYRLRQIGTRSVIWGNNHTYNIPTRPGPVWTTLFPVGTACRRYYLLVSTLSLATGAIQASKGKAVVEGDSRT